MSSNTALILAALPSSGSMSQVMFSGTSSRVAQMSTVPVLVVLRREWSGFSVLINAVIVIVAKVRPPRFVASPAYSMVFSVCSGRFQSNP